LHLGGRASLQFFLGGYGLGHQPGHASSEPASPVLPERGAESATSRPRPSTGSSSVAR
jgi:hypothetical protein